MGSVESAMTATRVMTILITPAKIGRSMKKCGKFMAIAVALEPRSFCAFRLSDDRLRVRLAGRRCLGYRRDAHTGLQQLQTSGDNFLAVFKPALHNPFTFEKGTCFKGTSLNRVIGLDDEGVFQPLLRADYSIVDKSGSIRRRAGNAHASKETRRDEVRVPVF